jgi:hypothetical protein
VVAGFRDRRWEPARDEVHLTKGLLQNMRSFGYTKVRYMGPESKPVECQIEDLLRA